MNGNKQNGTDIKSQENETYIKTMTDQDIPVTFDCVLRQVGEFGPYQRRTYFLLFLPTIFSAMHKLSWVFLGAKVNHRCRLSGELDNATYLLPDNNLTDRIPWNEAEGRLEFCSRFGDNGSVVECDLGWVYDKRDIGSSAVMDWDLVCGRKSMRATAQALFMFGVLIGSLAFGLISDRFGRKKSFFLAVVVQVVFGLLASVVPEYWSFILVRMVIGATTSGVFLVAYVLAMEMVGARHRLVAGTLCQYYYTAGFIIMAFIAYFLNYNWRMLQLALTIPTILFLSYWWIVPESVRWQIVNQQFVLAKNQLRKVAASNNAIIDDSTLDNMVATTIRENEEKSDQDDNPNFLDLFRHPKLRTITLIMMFNWMVISGTYYGLALSASNLGGSPYINFLISAAVEIPAYIINLLILNNPRVGRKRSLCGMMLFCGVVLTVTIFVPKEQVALLITLSMAGKLAITAAYGVVYIFASELYPTVVRSVGMGVSSMSARIGGILCPYINILSDYWTPLPLIIYGVLALVGGTLALWFPETQGQKLPDSIQEGEEFSRRGEIRSCLASQNIE